MSSIELPPLKYCLYARKSSESDEKQALSIESQMNEMISIAKREGIEIVHTIQESKSAKETGMRRGYIELIEGLKEEKFNAILTWAPDRLSRNAGDLGKLVDLMDQKVLHKIQTSSQSFTNTPDEKFLLMILCSQAKLENDNRGKNVQRGQKTLCEKGRRPGPVPIGYKLVRGEKFGEKSKVAIDKERALYIQKAFRWIAEDGLSGRQIKDYLENEGFRTNKGKIVGYSMVFKILKEPYYYGEFEYAGKTYAGSHKPIITKELYDTAQQKLQEASVPKGKWGRKGFYFNKILKCGECGSGISGSEHINRHGTLYTYYKCNKYGGTKKCKCKYIREEKLVEQVTNIVLQQKADHIRLTRRLQEDINKINRYRPADQQIGVDEYIAGVLREGGAKEKSDLLRCVSGRLEVVGGEIVMGHP